jgi:hypothetical protein
VDYDRIDEYHNEQDKIKNERPDPLIEAEIEGGWDWDLI